MKLALTVNCWMDEELMFAQQFGADQVFAEATPNSGPGLWDAGVLRSMRNRVEKAGLELAGINGLPLPLERTRLGETGRDAEIAAVCKFIAHAGEAGVPLLCYEWTHRGGGDIERRPDGRGGALVASAEAPNRGDAFLIPEWHPLLYFLERALPMAEKAGVRIGYCPPDIFLASSGGQATLNSVEGVKHLMAATASPIHGLDFRFSIFAGTPEADVVEAARFFASNGKLFLVTADNLCSSSLVTEAFLDEGTIDSVSVLRACRESGFRGTLRPGRQPVMTDDTEWGHKAQALAVGYLRALLQGLNTLK